MKRIQVPIPEQDLEDKITADCKRTGLKESQWLRLIVNKYYYEPKALRTEKLLKEVGK